MLYTRFSLLMTVLFIAISATIVAGSDSGSIRIHQKRGEIRFRAGDIDGCIKEFEYVVTKDPRRKPYHWQLGIAYYYAGKYAKGRDLFELHQKVNSNDVENAVWHFICTARAEGLESAREKLIPIKGDVRIPMMDVHALFAGEIGVEGITGKLTDFEKTQTPRSPSLMFAHLYLGLYYEATGDEGKAREHILGSCRAYESLRKQTPNYQHYMGDTAVIHALVRKWR